MDGWIWEGRTVWLSWENQTFLNTCSHLALSEKIKIHLEKQRLISLVQLQAAVFFSLTVELGVPQRLHLFFHKHTRILTRVLKAVSHLFRCTGGGRVDSRLETRHRRDHVMPFNRRALRATCRTTGGKHGSPHCLQDGKVALFNNKRNQTAGRDRGALQIKH